MDVNGKAPEVWVELLRHADPLDWIGVMEFRGLTRFWAAWLSCGYAKDGAPRGLGWEEVWVGRVSPLLWFAVGDVFGVGFAAGLDEGDFGAVGHFDGVVG